jgi:hypothetical protein
MFGFLIKTLAKNDKAVKHGAGKAQKGEKGVAVKVFAQAGRDAKKKKG